MEAGDKLNPLRSFRKGLPLKVHDNILQKQTISLQSVLANY